MLPCLANLPFLYTCSSGCPKFKFVFSHGSNENSISSAGSRAIVVVVVPVVVAAMDGEDSRRSATGTFCGNVGRYEITGK